MDHSLSRSNKIKASGTFARNNVSRVRASVEKERVQFRSLLLKNPNYFGNIKQSPYKPVKKIIGNRTYEELKCLGFNPQFDRLEAVVAIKKESGYGGNVCSPGSREYIRFFADWNNDGSWEDLGLASFNTYDIEGEKPIEYGVTLDISTSKKWCGIENLPKIKGILSWSSPPPENDPDFDPVWGNAIEVKVQIEPLKFILIKQLIEISDIKLPPGLDQLVDLEKAVPLAEPKKMEASELAEIYRGTGVPAHRFGFKAAQKYLAKPSATVNLMKANFSLSDLQIADFDISSIIDSITTTDGDTGYEELKCVGFENSSNNLVATLNLKKQLGYSGDLCKKGSYEYVAFWEWDQIEQMWLYLGTAAVNVHDIPSAPQNGLGYAVFLPVDMSHHLKPCTSGASLVRIRAILSWETPPPKSNPEWIPTWGNRVDALIHIKPGISFPETVHSPWIETVASMGVDDINNATGLADGESAGTAYFIADDSPFGGEIRITGRLLHPTDSFTGAAQELRYKVSVRKSGETWQPLSNSFNLKLSTLEDGIYSGPNNHLQETVDGVWYKYLEDYTGPDKRYLPVPILAVWKTGSQMTGMWEIRIDGYDPNTGIYWPGSQIIRVNLDQKAPTASVDITGFSRDGGPVQPAKICGKFQIGDVIHGTYAVSDEDAHFRVLTLGVLPGGSGFPSFGAHPVPSIRAYPGVSTNGESGTWTLDTSDMAPCGYVIHLWTEDRTVVNGGHIGWENSDNAGFCLEIPPS